jgi:selenocysteine-specific elongation factor
LGAAPSASRSPGLALGMTDQVSASFVIGTAGHVDHGKSTLIKALTGMDPDRLPQEKQRGMTIELGFAHLHLASGSHLSFVDVPGHERFVATMVAGATGIDAGMLLIAADEGIKPQTREHVDILDLLDVRRNIIVITKTDLVDGGRIEILGRVIGELVARTVLADAPIVPVSSRTGDGLPQLLSALASLSSYRVSTKSASAHLVIDRVFTMAGFGTIVTGSSSEPGFSIAEEVEILPGGGRARIRGIQQNGGVVDAVRHGRTALNLAGVARESIHRGDVIAPPGTVSASRRFDGLIRVLAHAPKPLVPNMLVTVHVGASSIPARVFPLTGQSIDPGQAGWTQFRLDLPIPLWRRQRFIVRQPSQAVTIAGGIIGDVSPVRCAGDESSEVLERLLSSDPETVLSALVEKSPLQASRLVVRSGFAPSVVRDALESLEGRAAIVRLGSRYFAAQAIAKLEATSVAMLKERSGAAGTSFMSPQQLRRALRLDPSETTDLVARMKGTGHVVSAARAVTLFGVRNPSANEIGLADEVAYPSSLGAAAADEQLLSALDAGQLKPPSHTELLHLCSAGGEVIDRLQRSAKVIRIADWLYLTPISLDVLLQTVYSLLEGEGTLTVSRLREELQTSRKYALAYVDYLDTLRITRRIGDLRVKGKNFEQSKQHARSS